MVIELSEIFRKRVGESVIGLAGTGRANRKGQNMRRRLRALFAIGVTTLTAAGFLTAVMFLAGAPQAKAAGSLVQVTNFGNNPTGLDMSIYVPDNVQAGRVVAEVRHLYE